MALSSKYMHQQVEYAGYHISDDPSRIDRAAVKEFLARSYWASDRPQAIIERSLKNSLCIGVYTKEGQQVGLARVISDYATFAYLCDVYVLEAHRGRGLAKAMMHFIDAHPNLQNLRRFQLVTQDAHGLYGQFGFKALNNVDRHMERRHPAQ